MCIWSQLRDVLLSISHYKTAEGAPAPSLYAEP